MSCRTMEKTKRTYQFDPDVMESFDEWQRRTRLKPSDATQLGLYLLMHLTADQRERLIGYMDARENVDLPGLLNGPVAEESPTTEVAQQAAEVLAPHDPRRRKAKPA